jgi:LysR family transcriptional regulator, low CO2-responsive transcriptional regulator
MDHRQSLSLLDLPQVETFVAVATHGSFAKAAAVLFLTQPSVSTRIQGLERTLGRRLFDRHGRGVRLTRAGGVFLPFAERLLHTVAEGRAALDATQSAEGGLLTVAAALSVSTYLLPDMIKGFRAEHPAVRVSIRAGHSRDVLRMVLDEEAEIGLARGLAHPAVQTVRLGRDEIVLTVPPAHRFSRRRQVTLSEVVREPLILFDKGSSDWILITGFFRRGGLLPNIVLELEGIEAAKKMVEKGIGISLLPHLAIRRELRQGTLATVPISDARPLARHVDLVYRRRSTLSEVARAFRHHVQTVYHALDREPPDAPAGARGG